MKHIVIPDTQVYNGCPDSHIEAAGQMVLEEKPDVLVVIGDWWDFPSLSTHNDRGNITYHNASYVEDLEAGIEAMEMFLAPLERYNRMRKKNKKKEQWPRMVFTSGNHEYRRNRMEDDNPKLKGALPTPEDYLRDKGFEVYPFKQKIKIDGINYCHLCPQPKSSGSVERAHIIARNRAESWTVGHSQQLDYYVSLHEPRIQCLIAGAFYQHDEAYKMGSNDHWRGLVKKTHVRGGRYSPTFYDINDVIEDYT